MRTLLLIIAIIFVVSAKAQTFIPGSYINNGYRGNFLNSTHFNDSTSNKKWFVTKYTGIEVGMSFFKGGSANYVAAPLALQLNRRLNNNLYAFASVSAAPTYVNFRSSFMNNGFNKLNGSNSFNASALGLSSRAELGLMYVNDEKTFSISGSIGVERNSYPMPLYIPANQFTNQSLPQVRK